MPCTSPAGLFTKTGIPGSGTSGKVQPMALKATICKAGLQIADMDRNYYAELARIGHGRGHCRRRGPAAGLRQAFISLSTHLIPSQRVDGQAGALGRRRHLGIAGAPDKATGLSSIGRLTRAAVNPTINRAIQAMA